MYLLWNRINLSAKIVTMEDPINNEPNCSETTNLNPNSEEDEEELHKLLLPDVRDLPLTPPSAVESNFVSYFAPGFLTITPNIPPLIPLKLFFF